MWYIICKNRANPEFKDRLTKIKKVFGLAYGMVELKFLIGYHISKWNYSHLGQFFIFQRIQGHRISNTLSMFGHSISSGIDADNNGYQGKFNNFDYSLCLKE